MLQNQIEVADKLEEVELKGYVHPRVFRRCKDLH